MENLWITLPAVAPDYSGVCSAMFDLGGISVIHDASGCTGNYTGYDEPRWYGSKAKVFSSGLREMDAVLGRDDKLIDNILKAGELLSPTMYTVIGSPVPMVIGTDMRGIAHELEERSGLPAFGFDMNGLGLYNKGISEALCALIKKLTVKSKEKTKRGVNILGTTPLDLSANRNAEDLKKTLESWGFQVVGQMMMQATLEQVKDLAKAEVNLVVTRSGLEAAELLKKKFGMPYVVGMPLTGSEAVREALEKTIEDGEIRVITDEAGDGVLIVGEQVLANSIRRRIREEKPQAKVTVATLYGLIRQIAADKDLDLAGEESLIQEINSGRYKVIIGDPLIEELIYKESQVKLISLPHVALSSKLYWKHVPELLGNDMDEIVHKVMQGNSSAHAQSPC